MTIGYGSTIDPPAWRRGSWTSSGPGATRRGAENNFTKDEFLTNMMVYWVTQSGASSARIYYENQRAQPAQRRVEGPTGCAVFPKDISIAPRRWVEGHRTCRAGRRCRVAVTLPRWKTGVAGRRDVRASFFRTLR